VVGLLTAYLLARMPATAVTVVDIDPARAAVARALGCDFAAPADAPGERELIVHASGSEAGLRSALASAAFEGRIVEASWYGDRAPSLPLGEAFHARRLRIIASQVGSVSPAMRGRRSHGERLAMALDLLADPVLDVLLDRIVRFADLPRRMPELLAGGLCHVVSYED
jgi:threonine dehydrogenase-like Zn-dependent dehydrogenase